MRAGRIDAGFRSKEKVLGSNYFVQFRKKSALVIRRQAWLSPPRRYMARANAAIAMLTQLLRVEFASLISFNQGVRND